MNRAPALRLASLDADLACSLDELRSETGRARVQASRQIVERALEQDRAYYGINTGFGVLARQRISPDRLQVLQENLLLSHAVGVGPLVPREISRLMLGLKIHALSLGHSGIAPEPLDRLLLFSDRGAIPAVPSKGSVGASGDLAPLAHMCLPLLGLGQFWDERGERTRPAAEVLSEWRLEPITLRPKDGLALINGTQLMSAYAAHILSRTPSFLRTADVIAATSVEALMGSVVPFDPRLHAVRPHPGQQQVGRNVVRLLQDSQVVESHRDCDKVQDPYSLRCVPQVHGASRDALRHASEVVEREINSVTDNPIVFEGGDILSGGNFHGQPLALAIDYAAIALAELASISERRLDRLLAGHDGLPQLLTEESGVNSGFMITQYTAAALVSENKSLCHPASVDSIPTSLGQEDHVSMGSLGALKLLTVYENTATVLGLELLAASQALDYRAPLRPGRGVAAAHAVVRGHIEHADRDHPLEADVREARRLIESGDVLRGAEAALGALE